MGASTPGMEEISDVVIDQEAEISYLTVGFWRRSAKPGPLSLLVLHSSQTFVLLSEEPWKGQQAQSRKLFRLVSQLNAKSPFRTSSCQTGAYMVVAFEIKWDDVCGLNYHNPLCLDGRVVMEAAKLTKRQFLTMAEAQKYYLDRVSPPQPEPAKPSRRSALRTYASSPDMSLPLVQQAVQLSRAAAQAHHHHPQHIQWQPDDRQQPQLPAHSHARPSGDSDPPSMAESSSAPPAAAPAPAPEAASDLKAPQIPTSPCLMHAHTKACLKHAGVGKMSPPHAREPPPKAAADHLAGTPVAYVQASSIQVSGPGGPYSSLGAASAGLPPVFESAFSGGSQGTADEQLHRQSGSSEHSVAEAAVGRTVAEQWPETCSWTVPCHVFKYRTVTFSFTDPSLPVILRPAINNNERLLKLYESGLPVWAIFLPTYGLYYRPWMRRLTWILFIAVSIFSMACGFYDLYKNVPHVDKVLRKVLGSLFLPSTAIFHWLEDHAQIRLSILLTYLFGESILFVHLLTWLDRAWIVAGRPVLQVVGPPLVSLGSGLEQWGRELLLLLRACAMAGGLTLKAVMGPPMTACIAAVTAVGHFLLPLWQVVVFLVKGPVAVACRAAESVQVAAGTLWHSVQPLGQLARSASGLVHTTSLAATTSGASVADFRQQVGWWWRWMPAPGEAWELMRISSLKTLRALQTLAKLASQLCSDISKHRLTLSRRVWRFWRRCKSWCYRALSAIVCTPVAVYSYLIGLWQARMANVRARNSAQPASPHEVAEGVMDASERPIMTGFVAAVHHDKAE